MVFYAISSVWMGRSNFLPIWDPQRLNPVFVYGLDSGPFLSCNVACFEYGCSTDQQDKHLRSLLRWWWCLVTHLERVVPNCSRAFYYTDRLLSKSSGIRVLQAQTNGRSHSKKELWCSLSQYPIPIDRHNAPCLSSFCSRMHKRFYTMPFDKMLLSLSLKSNSDRYLMSYWCWFTSPFVGWSLHSWDPLWHSWFLHTSFHSVPSVSFGMGWFPFLEPTQSVNSIILSTMLRKITLGRQEVYTIHCTTSATASACQYPIGRDYSRPWYQYAINAATSRKAPLIRTAGIGTLPTPSTSLK